MEYYYSEREYWNNQIIGKYITLPTECTNCKYSNIHLIEKPTLNNPFLMKCSKCGKIIYLRSYTIFGLFPRTPVSLIDKIIKYWLLNKLNASKIFEKLTKNDNIKLRTDQTIRNILDIIRQCIAHYLYDKYLLEILAGENERKKIAVDESLLRHISQKQLWIFGMLDTQSKKFRLFRQSFNNHKNQVSLIPNGG